MTCLKKLPGQRSLENSFKQSHIYAFQNLFVLDKSLQVFSTDSNS